ncbi:MAG: hypothetical protein DCC49_06410 [Acidobacteria bacterium]|nr:MAG: hypothetical protein DCC49_06410 [Acidobacteriota bacterium]
MPDEDLSAERKKASEADEPLRALPHLRGRSIPPLPEPGPPAEIEDFPEESPRKAGCLAALGAFSILVVGVTVILIIIGAFLTTQKRPFAESEEVTRAFLEAATAGDISGMRAELSEAGNRQISDDSLVAISRFTQDQVGRIVRLVRTEQELFIDDLTGQEAVHVAFVAHGSTSSATVKATLHGPGGGLRITAVTVREAK